MLFDAAEREKIAGRTRAMISKAVKLVLVTVLTIPALAQTCLPPAYIGPNSTFASQIAPTACQLSDGSSFMDYRILYPVRGAAQITVKGSSGFAPSLILRDSSGRLLVSGAAISRYMESGNYHVLVNVPGSQTGNFSLTSTFTPEANVLCRQAPLLAANQSINGSLSATSCKLLNNAVYDAYQMTVYGAGMLTIAMNSAAFDSYLILRDGNGAAIASDDNSGGGQNARISLHVPGNDTYTVVASAVNSSQKGGAYQLTTSFTPDPTETCVPMASLTMPSAQVGGSVSSTTSCNLSLPNRDDSALFNFYTLHVDTPGVAQIQVNASTFSPLLLLLDANGNEVAEDLESGGPQSPAIAQQLAAGDYLVLVFNEDSFEGDYTLQYNFAPGPASTCPVNQIAPDSPVTGTLSSGTSCRSSGILSDIYRLTLPSSGTLDMTLSSSDFSTYLNLRDTKDNHLYFGEQTPDGTSAHVLVDLPGGSYSLAASSLDLPGNYNLSYTFTPKPLSTCMASPNLPLNTGFVATLGSSSCTDASGQPVDYYSFTTNTAGTVAAFMTSGDIDSFLTLTDSKNAYLRSDNGSYAGNDAVIVQYLAPGSYKLQARTGAPGTSGLYRVDALFTAGSKPNFCAPAALQMGVAKNGNISFTGCQFGDGSFADIYQFAITNGSKPVTISLVSNDFDGFLELLDARGNLLAEDDNGGGGTNSQIAMKLAPGTYFLVTKPASDPSQTGSYTVRVQQ